MYILINEGLGQPASPSCNAAVSDLELLSIILRRLNRSLNESPRNPGRISRLKRLVGLQVSSIISVLDNYIKEGCCEPSLKTLETQVDKLPWTQDRPVQEQKDKLVKAIQKSQEKARKDFDHC